MKRARIDCRRWRYRRLVEGAQGQVDGHAERIVLEDRPVEAGEAFVAVAIAAVADHDVVAALAVHAVGQAFADEDVVAADRVAPERIEVVAGRAVDHADLDPVVAFVAEHELVGAHAEDEVVADAAEGFRRVLAGDDEVVAEAAEDQVDAVAAVDGVVAVLALDEVVAAEVGDDVVAGAAEDDVDAVAALEPVVAVIAVERVVADAGDDGVVAGGAAEDDVVLAVVLEVERIGAGVLGLLRSTSGSTSVPSVGSSRPKRRGP